MINKKMKSNPTIIWRASILLGLFYLCVVNAAQAEDYSSRKRELISRIIAQYEKAKDDLDNKLGQCYSTIEKCRKIIDAADKTGNKEAKQVAQKALDLTKEAELKYKRQRFILKMIILRWRNFLAMTSNDILKKMPCLVVRYKGNVRVYSADEEKEFSLNPDSTRQPKAGDTIITSDGGQIELRMLSYDLKNAVSSLIVGEKSRLFLKKDEEGTSMFDKVQVYLLKGKLYFEEKIEELGTRNTSRHKNKNRAEKIKEWEECTQTYGVNNKICRTLYKEIPDAFYFPTVAIAIRGTKVIISNSEDKGIELIVLKGSAILGNKEGTKIEIVDAGHKITASPSGQILGMQSIDISHIEKWWEDED